MRYSPGKRRSKPLKIRLTLQLQTALEAFRVSEENLTTAATAVVQAEENYRVNENRYQANVATTVDLLDAQEFLTRARNEKVKAFYDFHLAEWPLNGCWNVDRHDHNNHEHGTRNRL